MDEKNSNSVYVRLAYASTKPNHCHELSIRLVVDKPITVDDDMVIVFKNDRAFYGRFITWLTEKKLIPFHWHDDVVYFTVNKSRFQLLKDWLFSGKEQVKELSLVSQNQLLNIFDPNEFFMSDEEDTKSYEYAALALLALAVAGFFVWYKSNRR
jgi:hypothetical protein